MKSEEKAKRWEGLKQKAYQTFEEHQKRELMGVIDGSTEICTSNYVTCSEVYIGGLTELKVADFLQWRKIDDYSLGEIKLLTLDEIAAQVEIMIGHASLITVIINDPLCGEILQFGNYDDGKWYRIGVTAGYA